MKYPLISILALGLALSASLSGSNSTQEGIIGLWHFDDNSSDATASWSGFGRSSHGKIDYENAKVGEGAYSAVHGEESNSNWRHHATGRIRMESHAVIDGEERFGIAVWVRPVKVWSWNGRVMSFGSDNMGIANVPDEEGVFRIVNPGFVTEGAFPPFALPMDEWSHVAITADGERGRLTINGELISEAPQAGPLNGGPQLFLGAMDSGGVGLLGTYIDELIFYRGPADNYWASDIYTLTKNGEPYPYEAPEPPVFQPVERNLTAFLNVVPDQATITTGSSNEVSLHITETPLFGVYLSPRVISSEEQTLAIITDLQAHHCNTIVVPLNFALNRAPLVELFHQHNFYVFVIVAPPYGTDYVRTNPEAAQRDAEGNVLATASFYDPGFQEHLLETFLAEGLEGRGIDGLILDEPAHRDYRLALRTGVLYHGHPAEREAYERMFNEPFPDIDLTDNPDIDQYRKVMVFRQEMIHEWLDLVEDIVSIRAPNINYHIVFTPDNVSSHRYAGYLTGVEATGIDIDRVLESDVVEGIQMTAYLNAWGGRNPHWATQFLPQFKDRAHEAGKASIFWAQAYMESQSHVERGFNPGDISELIHLTIGDGVDGMLLWHYRGFRQESYDWDDFFNEFSEAAAAYQHRPAEGVSFEPVNDEHLEWEVINEGNGDYRLNITVDRKGSYPFLVRNRAGITQRILITAN